MGRGHIHGVDTEARLTSGQMLDIARSRFCSCVFRILTDDSCMLLAQPEPTTIRESGSCMLLQVHVNTNTMQTWLPGFVVSVNMQSVKAAFRTPSGEEIDKNMDANSREIRRTLAPLKCPNGHAMKAKRWRHDAHK